MTKVEFVEQSSDDRIPNVTTGKVDITCQFMTVTAERAQQVGVTIPYYREGVGLLMKAGASVVMGAAIAGMHFTGMFAATFTLCLTADPLIAEGLDTDLLAEPHKRLDVVDGLALADPARRPADD